MSDTYTTNVERIRARLIAAGLSPNKALNAAEKQASAKAKRANPGSKLGKRHSFKKNTDPVPPKEKKNKSEDIKKFAANVIAEIHGITGLVGPSPSVTGGPVGTPDVPMPNTGGSPLSAKYDKKDNDDPTKKAGDGKTGKSGFVPSAGRKAKVSRANPGSVTKSPETFENIEEEFGIK